MPLGFSKEAYQAAKARVAELSIEQLRALAVNVISDVYHHEDDDAGAVSEIHNDLEHLDLLPIASIVDDEDEEEGVEEE